jgi:hypothetical protein
MLYAQHKLLTYDILMVTVFIINSIFLQVFNFQNLSGQNTQHITLQFKGGSLGCLKAVFAHSSDKCILVTLCR